MQWRHRVSRVYNDRDCENQSGDSDGYYFALHVNGMPSGSLPLEGNGKQPMIRMETGALSQSLDVRTGASPDCRPSLRKVAISACVFALFLVAGNHPFPAVIPCECAPTTLVCTVQGHAVAIARNDCLGWEAQSQVVAWPNQRCNALTDAPGSVDVDRSTTNISDLQAASCIWRIDYCGDASCSKEEKQ